MKYFLIAAAAVLPALSPAYAQDDSRDVRVRVGLGAQLQPEYVGADGTKLAPLFDFETARGTKEFRVRSPGYRPGIALVSKNGFSFGPAANLEHGRKDSKVGAPVGKVPTTFEAGAFAQYEATDSYRVRAEVVKGIGGHEGIVGTIGADKIWRDGDRVAVTLGPRVLFADARYQRAFFGVSAAASLATGLPVYRPGSGVYGVAMASGASYQLNNRWGLFGYARYERLVGAAAKSPIVREFGSRNQLSGGIGLNYTFTIRR